MRSFLYVTLGLFSLIFTGCEKSNHDNHVVSQKYIHKYGYAVSKDEFESRAYPGQVITLLKNGVTITSNYEDGTLHGACTHTFPNSQTTESYYFYNKGTLVKQIFYALTGMPLREEVQISPTRYSVTTWYKDGTPRSIEEYASAELLEGQYFTMTNDLEDQVIKGKGTRVQRNDEGLLMCKEQIEEGSVTKKETFYPNGSPESIASYKNSELYGEKKTFTESGEPLSLRAYEHNQLNGISTFFKNGVRSLEVRYVDGAKSGDETHYLDGVTISKVLHWENGKLHGPSKYFVGDGARVEYYYDGSPVTPAKWKELDHLDQIIAQIDPQYRP